MPHDRPSTSGLAPPLETQRRQPRECTLALHAPLGPLRPRKLQVDDHFAEAAAIDWPVGPSPAHGSRPNPGQSPSTAVISHERRPPCGTVHRADHAAPGCYSPLLRRSAVGAAVCRSGPTPAQQVGASSFLGHICDRCRWLVGFAWSGRRRVGASTEHHELPAVGESDRWPRFRLMPQLICP